MPSCRERAFEQLENTVIKRVNNELGYKTPGVRLVIIEHMVVAPQFLA